MNRKHRREIDDERIPSRNDEYMLYQILLGTWPLHSMNDDAYRAFCIRIQCFMEKAIHEAKVHTSWVNPSPHYDQAMRDFVEAVMSRTPLNGFLDDFIPFQELIAHYGMFTALSQLMLKLTGPGIPDFYQGTELWDFTLVDPDNRHPVDYALRIKLIQELRDAIERQEIDRPEWVHTLADYARDGRIKLYTTMVGLDYRRRHSRLFQEGEYLPLESGGVKKQHVCAFARLYEDQAAVIVVPRLLATLAPNAKSPPLGHAFWEDSWIAVPPWPKLSDYRHVLTGELLTAESVNGRRVLWLSQVFNHSPVALLERLS
jgi:(1->4)-alpha-D-glucan 1-alpha-D-glucosylmutase